MRAASIKTRTYPPAVWANRPKSHHQRPVRAIGRARARSSELTDVPGSTTSRRSGPFPSMCLRDFAPGIGTIKTPARFFWDIGHAMESWACVPFFLRTMGRARAVRGAAIRRRRTWREMGLPVAVVRFWDTETSVAARTAIAIWPLHQGSPRWDENEDQALPAALMKADVERYGVPAPSETGLAPRPSRRCGSQRPCKILQNDGGPCTRR